MSFHLSRATLDRPKQTIHAAELVHENAPVIARACAEVVYGEVAVAVVDRRDMVFEGVWTVRVSTISDRVAEIEQDGWALIFGPGTSLQEVEQRALEMARLAYSRWETMRRWASKNR
jgi:hypothetical protein